MRTTRPRVQHNTKAACCTTSISVFDSILSVHHTQVPVPTYMMSPNPLRHGGFNTDEVMMPSTVSTCTPLSIRHIRRWEKDEKLSRQHGCSPDPVAKLTACTRQPRGTLAFFRQLCLAEHDEATAATSCNMQVRMLFHHFSQTNCAWGKSLSASVASSCLGCSNRLLPLSKSALLSSLRWPFHEKMAVPSGSITHPPIVHRTIPLTVWTISQS